MSNNLKRKVIIGVLAVITILAIGIPCIRIEAGDFTTMYRYVFDLKYGLAYLLSIVVALAYSGYNLYRKEERFLIFSLVGYIVANSIAILGCLLSYNQVYLRDAKNYTWGVLFLVLNIIAAAVLLIFRKKVLEE